MKRTFYSVMAMSVVTAGLVACNKTEPDPAPTESFGSFDIEMEYAWGMDGEGFALSTPLAHPMTGDTLTFDTFKHYVGHVVLEDVNGRIYTDAQAYALFDVADPSSLVLRVTQVPEGDYTSMSLVFGVDSASNVSGAQPGALDPTQGMFWSWNSGYIMIKAEGTSPQSPTGSFSYHLGGFSGVNQVQMERTFDLEAEGLLTIREGASPTLHFMANPARLFHTMGSVTNTTTVHMPGTLAGQMARDFHSWIYLDHIHP